MFIVPKRTVAGQQGVWWQGISSIAFKTAFFKDPSGHFIFLRKYTIGDAGKISPVVACGACDFRDEITLQEWLP